MIASIHQPQYLPYIGFFTKVMNSDIYVVLDNVYANRRDFTNRNRIKNMQGMQWISVPSGGGQNDLINEIPFPREKRWLNKTLKTLEFMYQKAQYFTDFYPGLKEVFLREEYTRLIDFDIELLKCIFSYLEHDIDFVFASELNVDSTGTQRLIDLTKKVGADSYLSGVGGRNYIDKNLFIREGIRLYFQDFTHPEYRQLWGDFIENLSVVDLIFNEGKHSAGIIKNSGKIVREVQENKDTLW